MDKSDNLFSSCGSGCDRLSPWTQMDWNKFATFSTTSTSPGGCKLVCWSVGRVELWANHRPMMIFVIICLWWLYYIQGSCTGVEFKASLEKSLNYIKLKKSLNCFGKQAEGLETFGICLCETFNKNWWLGDWELPATELRTSCLRPLIMNKCHARMLQIGVFFSSTSRVVCCRMIDWKKALNWPWIVEWKGYEKPWIFIGFLAQEPCILYETLCSRVGHIFWFDYSTLGLFLGLIIQLSQHDFE